MGREHLETPARSRFTYLHQEIRKRICLLHYRPGEKLYVEILAKEFDVGLSPVRRALNRLEADGSLSRIHRRRHRNWIRRPFAVRPASFPG